MIPWLKKHFIPHKGNDHRPHILRDYSIRSIIAIVILFEAITFLGLTLPDIRTTGQMAAVLPAVLANLANEERQAQNLSTLTINEDLNRAAEMKAQDMAAKGYFAHISPEGVTPWYWLNQVGYPFEYAGENLALHFRDSEDVTRAWMNSPSHRDNIVKDKYTEVGTGIATGTYDGWQTVFVVQLYANPIAKTTIPAEPKKTVTRTSEPEKIPAIATIEKSNVLGAEAAPSEIEIQKPVQDPELWQKAIASPRNAGNFILYILFGLVAISLLLYIFIKVRNHHVDLLTNGLATLAIIGAVFTANYYLSHKNMVITQSFDYSNQNR